MRYDVTEPMALEHINPISMVAGESVQSKIVHTGAGRFTATTDRPTDIDVQIVDDRGQPALRVTASPLFSGVARVKLTAYAGSGNAGDSLGRTAEQILYVNVSSGALYGTSFYDEDGTNALSDFEQGREGATVYLDENLNGRFDLGERSTITDQNGDYAFHNVPAGRSVVRLLDNRPDSAGQSAVVVNGAENVAEQIPEFSSGSGSASVDASGRYVVFTSDDPLLSQDSNAFSDVYLYDRQLNQLQLISVNLAGTTAFGRSHSPVISADGSTIAFVSNAGSLTACLTMATNKSMCATWPARQHAGQHQRL